MTPSLANIQAATHGPQTSVLAQLRALVPRRRLSFTETMRVTELQASRFREVNGIDEPQLPSETITGLPRIEVRLDADLPVSGSTHWDGTQWVITLNAAEPFVRRRFSLMHEYCHVLHHATKVQLFDPDNSDLGAQQAEWAADHFAACILMPKRWVKRLWGERVQRTTALATRFGVSAQAMHYRLNTLRLTTPPPRRCDRRRQFTQRQYNRTKSPYPMETPT